MNRPASIPVDSHGLTERFGSAEPPRLLDVRTPAEFETAHIPGFYNRGANCDPRSVVDQLLADGRS